MTRKSNAGHDSLQATVPPEGCQHYTDLKDVPWDIQKLESYMHRKAKSLTLADITTRDIAYFPDMMKVSG